MRFAPNPSATVGNDTRWVESLVPAGATAHGPGAFNFRGQRDRGGYLPKAKSIMEEVTRYGFCFAMDDVGAGFSTGAGLESSHGYWR